MRLSFEEHKSAGDPACTTPCNFRAFPSPRVASISSDPDATSKHHIVQCYTPTETRWGLLFAGYITFQRASPSFHIPSHLPDRSSMQFLQAEQWQQEAWLCCCCYSWSLHVPGSLLHKNFPYVKSRGAACSLPGKLDLLLAVTFISAWHPSCQEGTATLSSLCSCPPLAKCRSSLSCAPFAAVLAHFTGGAELQGLHDALSLQTLFSYKTSCISLQLVKKNKSPYLLLLGMWLILSPCFP